MRMKVLKKVIAVICTLIFIILVFFAVLTFTEFSPEKTQSLEVRGKTELTLTADKPYKIISWNTGYACLGKNADFFMDGGTHVKTADKNLAQKNLNAMQGFISKSGADFIFLQETDFNSSRSSYINQTEFFEKNNPGFESVFARNFKTLFVPYPVPPIGKVDSGIMTLSRFHIEQSSRISLPCPFSYPMRLCNLKRCLLTAELPVENTSRKLILVNLHLEAYDDGEGKKAQTKVLLDFLKAEQKKGNYIIAGGDFNQSFPDANAPQVKEGLWKPGFLDKSGFETFTLLMDDTKASCRSLDRPYNEDEDFQFYRIDGFIISKNINVKSFEAVNLEFENSDHNPVVLEFTMITD